MKKKKKKKETKYILKNEICIYTFGLFGVVLSNPNLFTYF